MHVLYHVDVGGSVLRCDDWYTIHSTLAAVGTLRPSKLMFVRRSELMLIGEARLSLRDGLVWSGLVMINSKHQHGYGISVMTMTPLPISVRFSRLSHLVETVHAFVCLSVLSSCPSVKLMRRGA